MNKISKIVLLASLIHSECGICTIEERTLIGQTVLNRIESRMFPYDIEGVIYQNRHFQGIWKDNCDYNKTTYKISEKLIEEYIGNPKGILYFVGKSEYKKTFAVNL